MCLISIGLGLMFGGCLERLKVDVRCYIVLHYYIIYYILLLLYILLLYYYIIILYYTLLFLFFRSLFFCSQSSFLFPSSSSPIIPSSPFSSSPIPNIPHPVISSSPSHSFILHVSVFIVGYLYLLIHSLILLFPIFCSSSSSSDLSSIPQPSFPISSFKVYVSVLPYTYLYSIPNIQN